MYTLIGREGGREREREEGGEGGIKRGKVTLSPLVCILLSL